MMANIDSKRLFMCVFLNKKKWKNNYSKFEFIDKFIKK